MSSARPPVSDVDVDLGQLFGSLVRYWPRLLLLALVVTGLAFLAATMATPKYRAETRILIESRESVFTRPSNATSEADRPLLDEEAITSQVEVISSPDILRDVARRLDLASHEEFGGGSTSSLRSIMVLIGLRSDPSQASVDERVVLAMRENLTVFRVDRSRVIVVRFSSEDPQLAASVPNAIAEAYIAVQEQAKLASNVNATDWLEPEIADLRQRVREAEARVADYRAQADLFTGQGGTSGLATQQLSELTTELTRVRANRSATEARAAAIREALQSGQPVDAMPDILNAALVQRLRERHAQLSADLADLSTSLLGNHPRIRALNAQLAESDQQLRTEMQKVLASLDNEASAAQTRERQLVADLNGLKAETARAEGDEVELRALEREATAQRELLESYLTRFREAAARSDRNYLPADARIFARATAPFEAYFPKVLPITAAAFIAALLLAAVGTLLAELFSGRAMRPARGGTIEPVEQVAMPVIRHEEEPVMTSEPAIEPVVVSEPVEVATIAPAATSAVARPQRAELSVELAAERLISRGAMRAVFISPEGDDAGASSVMVAREVSDAGLRVLFLDLTWSGAASASMLESGRYPGITNLLASESHFAEIIHGDLYSDCHVIPVGTADRAKAMRAADRLPIIMASLTTAYDLVVVECGSADAAGVGRVADPEASVLIGVLDPENPVISEAATDLAANGFNNVLKVSPLGHAAPDAPLDRSVA